MDFYGTSEASLQLTITVQKLVLAKPVNFELKRSLKVVTELSLIL